MSLQVYNFFQRNHREGRILKYTVRTLWVLHTLNLAFIMQGVYIILVNDFGNVAATSISPWSIAAVSLINSFMAWIIHCSYCYRVWELSDNNRTLTIPVICTSIITFCFGLASGIKLVIAPSFSAYKSTEWLLVITLVCTCFTDLYIALWLCWWLIRRSRGLSDQTHSMINTLILYAVATGLINSVFAILVLITGATLPKSYIFIAIDFFRNGVYANSFMVSLNARDRFRRDVRSQATVVTSVRFARETPVLSIPALQSVPAVSTQVGDLERAAATQVVLEKVEVPSNEI
ncbi:hypothetical protein PsYK624_068950 [Phanerochaete sordida]|uniref:DUF6534 domain-containing protein n=1 Tax=Phanerochaete sordida TaxID=48140 RepID=A0A9P3G9M4_9APHY|nr:hypothetical protein PsYK624_068950 [Phanerochaete sordida]